MIRILIFAAAVLALGFGFSWLADRPGALSIVWQDQLIEMSLMVAASIVVALIAAVMIAWWLVRTLWTSPHSVTRFFRARKRDRGYQALSTGLIATGAGNALLAHKMSARARGLIRADQEPLIHLLEAQTALIEGKYDAARKKFEQMVEDPETRELGLRGLYMEARRLGAHEAARQYAENAAEKAPYLPWAAQATLEFRCQAGLWDDAIRLLEQQRVAHVMDRKEADRLKAVLLAAKAGDRLESDPQGARDDALQALKLAKGLVPAALIAAKAYMRENDLRHAASVLEKAWKIEPHPEIASTYVRARSGDTAVDRLKRAERLESLRPNNIESLLIVAQAALDAKYFGTARAKAEAAARMASRESAYMLLADIEESETGDEGRVRHWMAQALRAPRDPTWVADGFVSDTWLPVSPVSGRLDAFEWRAPFGQLEGPVEEGRVAVDSALNSLPPVKPGPDLTESATPLAPAAPAAPIVQVSPAAQAAPASVTITDAPPEQMAPGSVKHKTATPSPKPQPETVAAKPVITEPFFGRPPDDPGVKDQTIVQEPKTRLKLF